MINYIKEDLVQLETKDNEYKLHACNCMGRWGRGIALAFAQKYPVSYEQYNAYCKDKKSNALGEALITTEGIICLMTSYHYAPPDIERYILSATWHGLRELALKLPDNAHVLSNRFNSGLFNVPWEKTETLILDFLRNRSDIKWTVCDL